MNEQEVKNVVEAALMVAQRPLSLDSLLGLFGEAGRPERSQIRGAVEALREEYGGRGIELVEVASGYRIQVRQQLSEWVSRLWEERPPRYSRALLETLALIAYRQPITRGEIEDVRGVSVSTNIIRTLLDRGWVRVLGHRDVPGKPAMYGTTRDFLDYFGLKKLDDLPSLAELRDIDSINVELDLGSPDGARAAGHTGEVDTDEGEPAADSDQGADAAAGGEDAASPADAEEEAAESRPADEGPAGPSEVVELPVGR
jgi:segregation and condensation protein B